MHPQSPCEGERVPARRGYRPQFAAEGATTPPGSCCRCFQSRREKLGPAEGTADAGRCVRTCPFPEEAGSDQWQWWEAGRSTVCSQSAHCCVPLRGQDGRCGERRNEALSDSLLSSPTPSTTASKPGLWKGGIGGMSSQTSTPALLEISLPI